jgi:hypothetical protein
MPGQPSLLSRCALALAILLAPAAARAATPHPSKDEGASPGTATHEHPCGKTAVDVVAGSESAKIWLSRCEGETSQLAVDQLSVLSRPATAPRPADSVEALTKEKGAEIAPGVRRLDGRLVERLRRVVEHFAKDGETPRVDVVSGFRPRGSGSFHSAGRAIDFRIDGVKNEALIAFCKTLPDTGCGYYPNNVFVHMDVRERGAGHVAWVDANNVPAETPHEIVHGAAAQVPASIAAKADVEAAAHPAPAAALGLSLAVPVETPAPSAELPALPKSAPPPARTDSAHTDSAHTDKVSRAHRSRRARDHRHDHTI